MFKNKEEIRYWLNLMGIKHYTINEDLTVDVDASVHISQKKLKEIPVQFGQVKGNFDCAKNELTTLKGSPHEVELNFNCAHNQLTILEYGPQKVGDAYLCHHNQLVSLIGAPSIIQDDFACSHNRLTTLFGCPKEVGVMFSCGDNQLTELDYLPTVIGYFLEAGNNQLTSLTILKNHLCQFTALHVQGNQLTTLEHVPHHLIDLWCYDNPLTINSQNLQGFTHLTRLFCDDIFNPDGNENFANLRNQEIPNYIAKIIAFEEKEKLDAIITKNKTTKKHKV